ncbi:hypothetical protein O181_023912 [Austropuccinia psidii MF-1]|uniref:Uncharacterized protein n=1 Tax=Austropuccinia psidii MF-1 TaxID=1389203 RepID=A0A9Q3GYG3_9BASI|nr:hypothetical protein [Austropuccinia psidii MF-1]
MFLNNSKGWLVYIPQTKEFMTSAWATFPTSSDMCNTIRRWSLPWMSAKGETAGKMDISFMVNSLSLGDCQIPGQDCGRAFDNHSKRTHPKEFQAGNLFT